jgi:hypothetical protein
MPDAESLRAAIVGVSANQAGAPAHPAPPGPLAVGFAVAASAENRTVTPVAAPVVSNLGFLTVLQEATGYLGGYLVTNLWGRPLEFRLSTAVQPNRIQQILYGGTLQPYICGDLIGKALVDKTGTPVRLILTDREPALDLRHRLETPVAWLAPPADAAAVARLGPGCVARPADAGRGPVLCHPRYPNDVPVVRDLLAQLEGGVDLQEPFVRIREAIGEARKMGVTNRAA